MACLQLVEAGGQALSGSTHLRVRELFLARSVFLPVDPVVGPLLCSRPFGFQDLTLDVRQRSWEGHASSSISVRVVRPLHAVLVRFVRCLFGLAFRDLVALDAFVCRAPADLHFDLRFRSA